MKIKHYAVAAAGLVGISVAAHAVIPTIDVLNTALTTGILGQDMLLNKNNKHIVDNQKKMCDVMEACKPTNWKATGESKAVLAADDAVPLVPADVEKKVQKGDVDDIKKEVKKLVYPTGQEVSEEEELAPGEKATVEQIRDNQQQLLLNAVSQGLANAEKSLAVSERATGEVTKLQGAAAGADDFTALVKVLGEIALQAHQKTNEITGLYAQILEINSLSNMTETDLSRKTEVAKR
ncbi:MAG: hypothetical protein PHX68_02045 [Alphaproteobacteria bacterium]|nr:hypothetical protein [Alphaproteobacteria bacterium]